MSKSAYSGPRRPSIRKSAERRPHAAVAERFRFFLESAGLSREAFVEAVEGAITARSLFSVLAGTRQPSRALALLIERIWGFRAAFLLEGSGAMWTEPRDTARTRLSPAEQQLVDFSRSSVENARALSRALEQARLWERLFARTSGLLRELEACGGSPDPADRLLYPLFAKLVYEECQLIAARFEQLESLQHRRRVHALTTAFTERFVRDVPGASLAPEEARELGAMLEPVMQRRRERARQLDEAISGLRATLENICELGSPKPLLMEQSGHRRAEQQRAALARLEASLAERLDARDAAPAARRAIARELSALRQSLEEAPGFWPLFKQLVEGLLLEVEPELLNAPPQSTEELTALHRRIIEPLRA